MFDRTESEIVKEDVGYCLVALSQAEVVIVFLCFVHDFYGFKLKLILLLDLFLIFLLDYVANFIFKQKKS